MTTALYPGTFDPFTFGHLDLVSRGLKIFDRIIVAVGVNPQKKPLFSAEERVQMIREAVAELPAAEGDGARNPAECVEVDHYTDLTVHYAMERGVYTVIRSLRTTGEYETELASAFANRALLPRLESIYLMPSPEYALLSSSVVREIAQFGGDVEAFVPSCVAGRLREKTQKA